MPIVLNPPPGGVSAKELIVLDPVEVATGRTELSLHSEGIWVRQEGPDWGDAEISQYMSEGERGEVPVDQRLPNRKITIPLMLMSRGVTTFDQARTELQQKVGLIQREGGWLRRNMRDGRVLFLDVVNATLGMGGGSLQAQQDIDNEVDLVLEALPDFYGEEVTLDEITEITEAEIATVLKQAGVDAVIKGDYPGRCRIAVGELDGDDQLGLLWGIRCRHYSADATAAVAYEAEILEPLDTAAVVTVAGASGGGTNNAVEHTNLGPNWTPVLGTDIGGATSLTHVGSYRVWARLRSPDGTAVKARFVWDVGDLTLPVENAPWTVPEIAQLFGGSQWYLADLGTIRLGRVPVGPHSWAGQIQAKGTVGGEEIQVDRLWFQSLDESAGRLRAPVNGDAGLADALARDEFNQTAGALTGKTAPVGGVWTVVASSDADDFAVETVGKTAQRTAINDTYTRGRLVTAGTSTHTEIAAEVDFARSAEIGVWGGCAVRVVDIDNFAFLDFTNFGNVKMLMRTATVNTGIGSVPFTLPPVGQTLRQRVEIDAAGRWFAWVWAPGSRPGKPLMSGQRAEFATGGALASGKVGLYDEYGGGVAGTRTYDNFAAWVPTRDAVMFASQSAELRTDGMFREADEAGVGYGPVSHVVGDLPRIPPSGLEGRPVELFVKATRGDLEDLPDAGIDDINARVHYRPSYLFVPSV